MCSFLPVLCFFSYLFISSHQIREKLSKYWVNWVKSLGDIGVVEQQGGICSACRYFQFCLFYVFKQEKYIEYWIMATSVQVPIVMSFFSRPCGLLKIRELLRIKQSINKRKTQSQQQIREKRKNHKIWSRLGGQSKTCRFPCCKKPKNKFENKRSKCFCNL